MGQKGGSSPAGSTTTSTTPFAPYFYTGDNQNGTYNPNALYQKAATIGATQQSYFPGQTYADPTQQQNQAISAQTNLAQNDPTMQAATSGLQPYLNGSMMNSQNPQFQNMVSQVGQSIAPSIDSHFNMNGRAGSGANNQAYASALSNSASQMAYQNYTDQSTNQLKAELIAPTTSQGNFNDISQLNTAGAQQQAQNQLPITQAMNQYYFNQQAPYMQASQMASLLNGTGGNTSSPYFTNPVGNALSTGIGALGLYNQASQATGGSSSISGLYNNLFGAPAALNTPTAGAAGADYSGLAGLMGGAGAAGGGDAAAASMFSGLY